MAKEVFMPKAGMDMREGTIIRWLAEVGEHVKAGDPLLEIETDKVSQEVESPADGVLLCKYFDDGAVVPVVTVIGYVGEAGEKVPDRPTMAGGQVRADDEAMLKAAEEPAEKQSYEYRVAVIGGGPAGYVAALRAARMGARVVLFEKDEVGGTCTNRGCIPMKCYMESARRIYEVRKCGDWGIDLGGTVPSVNMEKILARKDKTVEHLRSNIEMLLRRAGVETVREEAALIGRHHIRAGQKTYRAENIILACGAKAKTLDVPGADQSEIISSTEMFTKLDIPRELVIIGGGVIGCESASAWARFGSHVTLVEEQERIIPTFDADVSDEIAKCMKRAGISVITGGKVRCFERAEDRPVLVLRDGRRFPADRILIAAGRKPDLSCLGTLFDELDYERGKIMVDEYCRTNISNIYAAGDITNRSILAHSAIRMGEAAASTACGTPKMVRLNRAPLLLYTLPEAAGIGMTEAEARRQGDVMIGTYPFSANGRAVAAGETEGFVKVIADRGYGEILGVHIVGAIATELIVEAKTMMDMEITVYEVADIMHPHPTWSEAFMEACADAIGESLNLP